MKWLKNRLWIKTGLGAVGASYGGYSVMYLAGHHNGRFKTFIAHDGIFNFEQMYLTTEEMWFVNWDLGGPFWDKTNAAAQRSYTFSPHKFVQNWDTPILIVQGGKDYRVPEGQGLAAFDAAIFGEFLLNCCIFRTKIIGCCNRKTEFCGSGFSLTGLISG